MHHGPHRQRPPRQRTGRTFTFELADTRFAPAGRTDDPQLPTATSLVDYIFKRLALTYLPYEDGVGLGVLTAEERATRHAQPILTGPALGAWAGPARERPPRRRHGSTFTFELADCQGFFTVNEFDDGRVGEVFITVAKQGSTLAGLCDALAVAVSLGLQHGVPLALFVRHLAHTRFPPAGPTDDPQLPTATSLVDYVFQRLALTCLPYQDRAGLGVLTADERAHRDTQHPIAGPALGPWSGPARQRPPRRRTGRTFTFELVDLQGFFTVNQFDDGRVGELFISVAKQGSTLAGLCD